MVDGIWAFVRNLGVKMKATLLVLGLLAGQFAMADHTSSQCGSLKISFDERNREFVVEELNARAGQLTSFQKTKCVLDTQCKGVVVSIDGDKTSFTYPSTMSADKGSECAQTRLTLTADEAYGSGAWGGKGQNRSAYGN
jgi:hypothetical protein